MMRVRGSWRNHRDDSWTRNVLLNLTTAPFTRFFLMIVNNEPTTREPSDPTIFIDKIVIATYGLGAALEGELLPPRCFPTSSIKGKPRDKESHVLNRLLAKLIKKGVFEPSQPDDVPIIRSKCAPWKTEKDLNEVSAELQRTPPSLR